MTPVARGDGDQIAGLWLDADQVGARSGVDVESVERRITPVDLDRCGEAGHAHLLAAGADVDAVVAECALDQDPVGGAVGGGRAAERRELPGDDLRVGAAEVVDAHRVGAARDVDVEAFDVAGVHDSRRAAATGQAVAAAPAGSRSLPRSPWRSSPDSPRELPVLLRMSNQTMTARQARMPMTGVRSAATRSPTAPANSRVTTRR
jgi:hypothetical protein